MTKAQQNVEALLVQYAETMDRSHAFYEALLAMRSEAENATKEELTDVTLVLREISRVLKDSQKECFHLSELCEKIACLKWIAETQNDVENAKNNIHGTLARATPDLKQAVSIPSRDKQPEAYYRMMKSLGAVTAARKDLVRPHWPGLTDHISMLMKNGKQVPDGIDPRTNYHIYRLSPVVRLTRVDLEGLARAAQERRRSGVQEATNTGSSPSGQGDDAEWED